MNDDFTQPVNVRNMRPGFFIKTAIDLLLQSAGYKGTGSLLVDPLYPLLIAQFSNGNFEHGTDYQNQPDNWGIAVENLMQTSLSYPNVSNPTGVLNWYSINSDPSRQFSGNTTFTSNQVNNVIITVTLPHLFLYGRITPTNFSSTLSVFIRIHQPGLPDITPAQLDFSFNGYGEYPGDPKGWSRVPGTNGNKIIGSRSFYNSVLSYQTTLPAGASVDVYYEFTGYTGSHAYIYPNATFSVKSQNGTVQFGQTVQCERIFPDISQKELLKDTLQRFGIVCQTDNNNKTIAFNSFKDIVNNIPIAKDWTTKCLDQGKQVAFQLGNYAQVNYMQYQEDANVLPLKFGWSQINIANQTLPASAQLFVSPFGVSLNRAFYGGTVAQIRMIDNTSGSDNFSIGVVPRILIDQKLDIGALGKTITFTDGAGNNRYINDIISTPYFYKPDAPEPQTGYGRASLLFDDLRRKYYPELEKIQTQTKKVVRYMLLTPRDILELDLLIPLYIQQDGAYYYINKINAWRKGQPTKVELVKLG
jgi:hypothetical protein